MKIAEGLRRSRKGEGVHSLGEILMLEKQVMLKDREKLELEREIEEVCIWWRNVYLQQ